MLAKVSTGEIAAPSGLHAGPAQTGTPLPAGKIKPLPHIAGGRVPAALSAVAMKALSLAKENRYQRGTELGADIEAYQGGFATGAEQAGALKQLGLLMRRHKGVTAALAAIVLMSIVFIIKLIASEHRAVANEAAALEQKEAARRALADSSKSVAEAWLRDSNGPAMKTVLEKVPEDLRDSRWHYLHAESDSSIARFPYNIEDIAAHAKQPGVFAITTDRQRVIFVNVKTGAHLLEITPGFSNMDGTKHLRVAVSPDGELIAIGRDNPGGIVIHSVKDGAKLREWEAPVTMKLEFNADSTLLMQTVGFHRPPHEVKTEQDSANSSIRVWDPSNKALLWEFKPENQFWVRGVFTGDGKNALVEAWGDLLHVVDAKTGAKVRELGVSDVSNSVAVSPHSPFVVSGQRYGQIQSTNLSTGEVNSRARLHNESIFFTSYLPNGQQFVTVANLLDGRRDIRIWNSENVSVVRALLGGRGWEFAAALHPVSGELFLGGEDNRAWVVSGPPPLRTLPGTRPTTIEFWGSDDTLFAPNGTLEGDDNCWVDISQPTPKTIWATGVDGYGTVFSGAGDIAAVGRPFEPYPVHLVRRTGANVTLLHRFQPATDVEENGVKLSREGNLLAVREKGAVEIFSLSEPKAEPKAADISTLKAVRDIAWVLNGTKLIGTAEGKDAELIVAWDPATGRRIASLPHSAPSAVIAVAPDGKQFAEAGNDQNIRIRDAATLAILKEFRASNAPITAIAWHPHRPIIAVGSEDQSVRIWDYTAGKKLDAFFQLNTHPVSLSFSPSGKRLAGAQVHGALVWEPESLSGTTPPGFVSPTIPKRPAPTVGADGFAELLSTLTPESVLAMNENWQFENGILRSSKEWVQTLPLAEDLGGKSYELKLRVRREPLDLLSVILPVGTSAISLEMESYPDDGFYFGLTRVQDKGVRRNSYSVRGPIFPDTNLHEIGTVVQLLPGDTASIQVSVDGKKVIEWQGPTSDLRVDSAWSVHPSSTLALGAQQPNWEIHSVKLRILPEK